MDTMVATDIIETNKNLAGYGMNKNTTNEIMFQKEDILIAFAEFLNHCPKPQYEPEEKESSEEETPEIITVETQ